MNPPTQPTDTTTSPRPQTDHDEYSTSSKRGPFRFKSSKRRHHRDAVDKDSRHHRRHHRRRHHHHSSSSKRHKSTHDHDPSTPQDDADNGIPRLSPEAAFRESLFDALGDDEGAEYWESVYGQPIHTYAVPNVAKGPQGELEQMDEEEYATYVRVRMWERTREGMMEEQERLRREKIEQRKKKEREAQAGFERRRFEQAMDESLRRGQERRRARAWKGVWGQYLKAWEEVDRLALGVKRGDQDLVKMPVRNLVFWPVVSGKRRDVSRDTVEEFMKRAPAADKDGAGADAPLDLMATLKMERIRWHPDKIQHRYGILGIDDVVLQSVTEVFQIVDRMWNELKEKDG